MAEDAGRGVAVQDTELGVVARLPDAKTGRDGGRCGGGRHRAGRRFVLRYRLGSRKVKSTRLAGLQGKGGWLGRHPDLGDPRATILQDETNDPLVRNPVTSEGCLSTDRPCH